jgi:hypothetical protein
MPEEPLMTDCMSADELLEAFGTKALLVAPIMVVAPVISFFQSEFDAVGDQIDGRSDETVQVTRSNLASLFSPYVGIWHVHGTALTVESNRTGSSWAALSICDPSSDQLAYCWELESYSFDVTSSGITATLTSVNFVQGNQDSNGSVIDQQPPPAGFVPPTTDPVGTVYDLKLGSQDTLVQTQPQDGSAFTWCGIDTPYSTGICGG